MRDPHDCRSLTDPSWAKAVERAFEIPVEVPDTARALGKLTNMSALVLLRPGATGRADNSGLLAPHIFARSEADYHERLRQGRLGNLNRLDGGEIIEATFGGNGQALVDGLLPHDASVQKSIGKGLAAMSRATAGAQRDEAQKHSSEPWECLAKIVKAGLLARQEEFLSQCEQAEAGQAGLEAILLEALRGAGQTRIPTRKRGFGSLKRMEPPILGYGLIAQRLTALSEGRQKVATASVRDAVLDLVSFFALRLEFETDYIEAVSRMVVMIEAWYERQAIGRPVTEVVSDTEVWRVKDELSRIEWERSVKHATDLYLEAVRGAAGGAGYAKAVEAFLADPVLWAWLGSRAKKALDSRSGRA